MAGVAFYPLMGIAFLVSISLIVHAGSGLAGWVVEITPGVRMVNQRFQNVGPDESPA